MPNWVLVPLNTKDCSFSYQLMARKSWGYKEAWIISKPNISTRQLIFSARWISCVHQLCTMWGSGWCWTKMGKPEFRSTYSVRSSLGDFWISYCLSAQPSSQGCYDREKMEEEVLYIHFLEFLTERQDINLSNKRNKKEISLHNTFDNLPITNCLCWITSATISLQILSSMTENSFR